MMYLNMQGPLGADAEEFDLGCGNGMSFVPNGGFHYSTDNRISCLFAGDMKSLKRMSEDQVHSNGKALVQLK